MADSTRTISNQASTAVGDADGERWPVPQTAMFVALTSAALWAVILAAARWLFG